MNEALPASARKVQERLGAVGIDCQAVRLPGSARTAKLAAAAIGCEVAQIVKSLVFRGATSGEAVLVVASGVNRVDEARIAAQLGEAIEKPDADFVRAATGFAIGGVPPAGHERRLRTFVDQDLLGFAQVWAAAGHPHTVFPLAPADLPRMTAGAVIDVK